MNVTITKGFTEKTCGTCGVVFFIPDELEKQCLRIGQAWVCPNGHRRSYTEPESEKYKRLYEEAEASIAREQQYKINAINSARRFQKQLEQCQSKMKRNKNKKPTDEKK